MYPKVSVIIPVHNNERSVEAAIRSAMDQTLEDIEILCIDDASTDRSPSIIKTLANKDSRIIVQTNQGNQGTFSTRKRAAAKAVGETIMFLDGDDLLEPHACETAYYKLKELGVEIFHFGTRVLEAAPTTQDLIDDMQDFTRPFDGFLYDEDIFDYCFYHKQYGFNLWNKIYAADLLKEVYSSLKDDFIEMAEDALFYFALALKAQSYAGDSTLNLYRYNYGIGISTRKQMPLECLDRVLDEIKVLETVSALLHKTDKSTVVKNEVLTSLERRFLSDAKFACSIRLKEEAVAQGFKKITEAWGGRYHFDAPLDLSPTYAPDGE